MTTYAEAVARVRHARAERDAARDGLYALELRRLALHRAAEGTARGERLPDPALADALRPLRREAAEVEARRRQVEERLAALASLPDEITALRERIEAAAAESAAILATMSGLADSLDTARTPADRDRLQEALRAAQALRAVVEEDARRDTEELGAKEADALAARELRAEARALDARAETVRERTATVEERGRDADLRGEAARNEEARTAARRAARGRDADLRAAIDALYDGRTPQELLGEWDDSLPIVLLPLRVETRWKTDAPGAAPQLWVRAYPDDVAVATHEQALTDAEIEHGRAYWTAVRAAGGAAAGEATAWRALAQRFGANRAAWVARSTRPGNWEAATADATVPLQFAEPPLTKPDAWTTAPHSRVLPDRLVLLAWRGDTLRVSLVGEPIDDVVVLGPSPLEDPEGGPGLSRDAVDQSLAMGESFRWVRDFDSAVTRGMGFRVDLSAQDVAQGFDRLLVLGLKLSADAPDAQALVEQLIDNHHYSRPGFELLRQGTPTNNTDSAGSGYSRNGADEATVAASSPPRFTPAADRTAAADGQRFADFLGISYAPLLHAAGAGQSDHAEAVAMNRALYAGTLGYYVDHMLNETVDDAWLGALRRHFTDLVTGRGPVAAMRVGSQPYGILPTSSLARWQPTRKRGDGGIGVAAGAGAVAAAGPGVDPFESALLRALRRFGQAWNAALPGVRQIGGAGNGAAHLLEVLGLQPTSAEFHQRVGFSYDYLKNLEQFAFGGSSFDDVVSAMLEGIGARTLLAQLGADRVRADGSARPTPLLLHLLWQHYHTKLDAKQLVDGRPLSETALVQPYDAAGARTYLDWLLENASNADALERQDFGAAPRPGALLYLMLHFALVMEAGRGIHRWLDAREVRGDELVRSRKFLNVGSEPTPSLWEVFRAPADRVVRGEGALSLLQVVHAPQNAGDAGRWVQEQRAALEVLRALPTARLERTLVEHVDTLSYRLDAWETSLFTRRLHRQRRLDAAPEDRRTGVYLGAYGYLEQLRPASGRRRRVDEAERPPSVAAGALYTDDANGGHVHAPSLNHATAAALLRSGYLTHATPADPDALAVDLSSARVQRAKTLVDGVRNGQSLEVLLGIQFERGLHDWTTRPGQPVILDDLKPLFRQAFPIRRTRVPQANDASQGAAEVSEDYKVVNGLELARTTAPFPYGIAELSALDADRQAAIRAEKAAIADALDSLRDLLTAESAYQLALGNFDRAAAVLQASGNGTVPPDIQVLDTPRATEISFTQRLAVQLDASIAASPWPGAPGPRARLEPALNAWLGDLLGAPGTVRCRAQALDGAGNVLVVGGAAVDDTVSLADLQLQPLDFVYLVRNQVEETGAAELETRVRYAFARRHDVPDDVVVRIAFADAGADPAARSFAEVLPLADRLRRLLGTARPLDARHFQSASRDAPAPAGNPGRIEPDELRTRVGDALNAVRALFPTLQAALAAARATGDPADLDALRDALVAVAGVGVAYALPRSAVGAGAAALEALGRQADAVLARAAALGLATDAQLAKADAAGGAEQKVELLADAVKAWMGGDTVLLPRFAFHDTASVGQADATRDDLLAHVRDVVGVPLPTEEWLHGAACVRPRVHDFEMVRAMADAVRDEPLALSPIQLPFRAGDRWLGAEFPAGTQVLHDTVSIVQHLPQGFDPLAARQCGLLLDEWVESMPGRDVVTGIAFNYDAPNSTPPQALLLAVTPDETGRWQWDDLVDSVLETFHRARRRAVEPDMIGDMQGVGTLLPAVVAEFGTSAASVSLDYSFVVTEIREPVLAMMTTATVPGGG